MRPAGANNLVLSSIPWTLFCTLTFRKEQGRGAAGRKVELWLRWVARAGNLDFDSNFYYGVRYESGEKGGRLHAHSLIRLPRFALRYFLVPKGTVSVAHKRWGHGLTRFRRVDVIDPAIDYFDKLTTKTSGADRYEMRKTDFADDVVLGRAVMKRFILQQSEPSETRLQVASKPVGDTGERTVDGGSEAVESNSVCGSRPLMRG